MNKRVAGRHHREGIKVKHVLQISLLLGICFWLLYQIKHSHYKKKELDENNTKLAISTRRSDVILKLGRKNLDPYRQEATKDDKKEEPSEEDNEAEEEISKGEDNEHEKEEDDDLPRKLEDQLNNEDNNYKYEEEEEEHQGEATDKKDEYYESDREKTEQETKHDNDSIEEEKEKEEQGGEHLSESNEVEDKGDGVDHETMSEDQDPGVDDQYAHEAREMQYRADDASSEVSHVTRSADTESEKVSSENTNEKFAAQVLGKTSDGGGNGDLAESKLDLNNDEKDKGTLLKDMKTTYLSDDQAIPSNKSTESTTGVDTSTIGQHREDPSSTLPNETAVLPNSTDVQNLTVHGATTGKAFELQGSETQIVDNNNVSDSRQSVDRFERTNSNATASSNSFISSETNISSDTTITPGATVEAGINSVSPIASKNTTEASLSENSDMNNQSEETTKETGSSTLKEIAEAIMRDPIDASDSVSGQDEKEALIDPGTLPEGNTEVVNSWNAADD